MTILQVLAVAAGLALVRFGLWAVHEPQTAAAWAAAGSTAVTALLIFSRTARRVVLWILAGLATLFAIGWLAKKLRPKPDKFVIVRPPREPRFRKPPRGYWPWPFDERAAKGNRDFDDDIPF